MSDSCRLVKEGARRVIQAGASLMIQATELNIGSCFLRSIVRALGPGENQALAREVGVPQGYVLQCGVIVGNAAVTNKFELGPRRDGGTLEYID